MIYKVAISCGFSGTGIAFVANLLMQDAHECWSAVVNALADRLPIRHSDPSQVSAIAIIMVLL